MFSRALTEINYQWTYGSAKNWDLRTAPVSGAVRCTLSRLVRGDP
jgi:hypothetical protein